MNILIACCLPLLAMVLQSYFHEPDTEEEMRTLILARSARFTTSVHQLDNAAKQYAEGKLSVTGLRRQLTLTRNAYKGIEYIVEYYYPEHTKEYLNGPPLHHRDPYPYKEEAYYSSSAEAYINSAPLDYLDKDHFRGKPAIIAPRGLQVLDELVFSTDVQSQEVLLLTATLVTKWETVEQALHKRKFFRRFEIIEAARLQLIRTFTLGITGFDTPGSQHGIDETKEVINALREVTGPLLKEVNRKLAAKTSTLFKDAAVYLSQHRDFYTFDRLSFLTVYTNPLYAALLDIHRSLGLTTTEKLSGRPSSWNFYSDNIFSEDFLDPYYYTLLSKEKDSDTLRLLGKKLFYDRRLSHNNRLSCGSCHQPGKAFTDGVPLSYSWEEGKTLTRNAPGLINSVFADRYFYDLRAFDLEEQAGHVIRSHQEFDTNYPELLNRINGDSTYSDLFNRIFHNGSRPVSRYQFSAALTSYVLSLRSFNSPFDRYVRGEENAISSAAKEGFNLFMGKANCGTCHYAPLFSGLVPPLYHESEAEVPGVLERPGGGNVDKDKGRAGNKIFQEDADIYQRAFKTMTVRNAALTAPYFHNGAYPTLNDVIDFYDKGGANGRGAGDELPGQTLSSDQLQLSEQEKGALIAFMQSLTDSSVIIKFSQP